jgi:hypothetical protein
MGARTWEKHMKDKCICCKYFDNRSALIESTFPGLNSLSSAYGSVWGESGICSLHDLFLSPWRRCADFQSITVGEISLG